MVTLETVTLIDAPIDRCFDLARSVEVHLAGNVHWGEAAVATGGVTSGLERANGDRCRRSAVWLASPVSEGSTVVAARPMWRRRVVARARCARGVGPARRRRVRLRAWRKYL